MKMYNYRVNIEHMSLVQLVIYASSKDALWQTRDGH